MTRASEIIVCDEMTIDDAINVASVLSDLASHDADADTREMAIAAKRLVKGVDEQPA